MLRYLERCLFPTGLLINSVYLTEMIPGLYIHIPFCSVKCDYCDFYSITGLNPSTEAAFLQSVKRQLEYSCNRWEISEFSTVYFGGGTPSVLSPVSLEYLFSLLKNYHPRLSQEFTFEANPESLSIEKIKLLEESPVNRLSMGIQSFSDSSRGYLGRRGDPAQIDTALGAVESGWHGRFSVDFIRGIPGELSISLEEELLRLPLEKVDHISVYDLTVEAGTPLADRVKSGPAYESFPESSDVNALLSSYGFNRYEVSNYCRKGFEGKHNQAYWEMSPYLGLGPGAVSLMYENGSPVHVTVAPDVERFITLSPGETVQLEYLSRTDFFIEHLIMGLRQIRGMSLELIQQRFQAGLELIIPESVNSWVKDGLCTLDAGRLKLTNRGFRIQNSLVVAAWQELDKRKAFA